MAGLNGCPWKQSNLLSTWLLPVLFSVFKTLDAYANTRDDTWFFQRLFLHWTVCLGSRGNILWKTCHKLCFGQNERIHEDNESRSYILRLTSITCIKMQLHFDVSVSKVKKHSYFCELSTSKKPLCLHTLNLFLQSRATLNCCIRY